MKHIALVAAILLAAPAGFAYTITTDTLWSGNRIATESVTVADGATLRIDAGTTVQLPTDAILRVEGRLLAEGTAAAPIVFTRLGHAGGTGRWGKIRFSVADGVSRLVHCRLWYANGGVQSAEGNEGIVSTRRSHVVVEDFDGQRFVGDVFNIWEQSTATLRRCYIGFGDNTASSGLGEGVHGDGSDIEEDACTFSWRLGRCDASDIQGQGHRVWVHDCRFLGSPLDDGCDFDNCNGTVERCVFMNYLGQDPGWEGRCGGTTMNEASAPLVRFNLYINCRQGIISKGETRPTITNCTFINCFNDIAAYEAGEPSPRQVGHPTVRNCIMWGTTSQTLVLGVDSGTASRSTVDLDWCDVASTETLHAGDTRTTIGAHILSADPLFIDGEDGGNGYDAHLRAGSPCIRAGENGVDLGAFPFASAIARWRYY